MNIESLPHALVIRLPHPVVSTNVAELRASLSAEIAGLSAFPAIEVDLEGCPSIDSSGLNLLASIYREATQRQIPFKVTNPSKDIHRLLTFLKLTDRFGIAPYTPGK